MPFLVYFAVLAITIAGAALGLDALTAPPPELKQKIAAGSTAPKPRQIPIDRPAAPTVVTPAPATEVTSVAPADETVTTPTPIASVAPAVIAAPAPPAAAETTGAASAAGVTVPPSEPAVAAEPPAAAVASGQIATPVSATANSCNVQACAAAYRSFRESDCTYQPFEGERRLCERTAQDTIASSRPPETARPAEPRNEWTARSNSRRDAELRAVERRVRELTQDEFDDRMSRRSRRVIVVETPYGEEYVTPESYSRRWQSPGWR